jgi:hypothetical protein
VKINIFFEAPIIAILRIGEEIVKVNIFFEAPIIAILRIGEAE